MKRLRFESFAAAFFGQKALEFVVLTALLAVQVYVGTRLKDPSYWGMRGAGPMNASDALLSGLTVASLFFVFTLYPIATYAIVALCQRFDADTQSRVALLSPLVSVGYVALWVHLTDFHFPIVPYWIETAIMALFIFISSLALYPPARAAAPAVG